MSPWPWLWERFARVGLPVPPPKAVAVPEPEPPPPPLVSVAQIVEATHCPRQSVAANWPLHLDELAALDVLTRPVAIAVAATVAVETGWRFAPVRERYNGPSREAYFEAKYSYRTSVGRRLGNILPGDGSVFYGRGTCQLTGRDNYTHFGRVLGVRLAEQPDLALDPVLAARITARYFQERGVCVAANLGDWPAVRRRVNGGLNGWDEFIGVVRRLDVATAGGPIPATEGGTHVVA